MYGPAGLPAEPSSPRIAWSGYRASSSVDDRIVRRLVGPRDDVRARRLLLDLGRPIKTFHQPLATGPGRVERGFEEVRLGHAGEVIALALDGRQ